MSYRDELLSLHNKRRKAIGRKSLSMNGTLNDLAQKYANQMANANWSIKKHGHKRPNGQSFTQWWNSNAPDKWDKCTSSGCRAYAGENLGQGQRTASQVFNGWMNSATHKANIEFKNFNKVGFGKAEKHGDTWWVAHFVGD